MLHCFRKVKCKLGDTPGSSLQEFNVSYKFLQSTHNYSVSEAQWLVRQGLTATFQNRFPVGHTFFCLSIAELCSLKCQLYLGLCGQLADYYSHFFSLIHPLLSIEFPFKEMTMFGQSKILSCCLCLWCKSRKLGGRGSPGFPTAMVESFSADLLPALKHNLLGFSLKNLKDSSIKTSLPLPILMSQVSNLSAAWSRCMLQTQQH